MQYIKKQNSPPVNWDNWFSVPPGRRTYDYGRDYSALTRIGDAKRYLHQEQHGLCAYCQQLIALDNASIEHVIPKTHNLENSTNYFNLVAVCKNQVEDEDTGRGHCDKERGSKPITPLIFHANSSSLLNRPNVYFSAYADGSIVPKRGLESAIEKQVEAFIEVLNLNHKTLKSNRRAALSVYLPPTNIANQADKRRFMQTQYNRILNNPGQPYREFLLIYLAAKLGF